MDFLTNALRSLPSVAASPYAFFAYLAVLTAWVIIAWRVKRNKNLLENLEKFPKSHRLQVVREEMGMPLKTSLTPEQWLRARTHRYIFWGFLVTVFALLTLFIVSAFSKTAGNVSVGITTPEEVTSPEGPVETIPEAARVVTPEPTPTPAFFDVFISEDKLVKRQDPMGYPGRFKYVYTTTNGKLHIWPEDAFTDLQKAGGPILYTDLPPAIYLPTLSTKLVNNSDQTIFLSELVVRVNSSEVNTDPILTVDIGGVDQFSFKNFGWGKVINPAITFGFMDEDKCNRREGWGKENHSLTLPSSAAAIPVNIGSFVSVADREEGTDEGGWKVVCAYGTLRFSNERKLRKELKFKVPVVIKKGERPRPRRIDEYGNIRTGNVYKLFLEVGKANYEKHIPLSQVIKPGAADHFSLIIETSKSANFELDLSFVSTAGIVVRKDVELDVVLLNYDSTL